MKHIFAIIALLGCWCTGCATQDVTERTLGPGEYSIHSSSNYIATLSVYKDGRFGLAYLRRTRAFESPAFALECASNFVSATLNVPPASNTGKVCSVICSSEGNTIHTSGLLANPNLFLEVIGDADGDGFPDNRQRYLTNGSWTVDSITYQFKRIREDNSGANKTLDATSQ